MKQLLLSLGFGYKTCGCGGTFTEKYTRGTWKLEVKPKKAWFGLWEGKKLLDQGKGTTEQVEQSALASLRLHEVIQ